MAVLEPVGTVMMGVGAYRAGRFAKAQADRDAEAVMISAVEASNTEANNTARIIARGKVAAASSGLTVDGSVLTALASLAEQGERERQRILWSGREEAEGLREAGREKAKQGRWALAASLVKAGAQTADMVGKASTGGGGSGAPIEYK